MTLENSEFITKGKHSYLIKAYSEVENKNSGKYLIIPDTVIKPNTYNTVYFEIPYLNKEVDLKIIQASAPFQDKELDTEIFMNPKTNSVSAVPTAVLKSQNGILIKQGKIYPQKDKLFALSTYYKTSDKTPIPKSYAIIVKFEE